MNTNNFKYFNINLGIVCPMANEKDNAEYFTKEVIERCKKYHFKSIKFFAILDNASKDGTIDIMHNLSKHISYISYLKVIFVPDNRSVVDAYIRGYQEAIDLRCDWILEIDAGYSHQPKDMIKFFNTMSKGYDCVFGSRFCLGGKFTDSKKIRFILSRGGTILINLLLGTKLNDMTSGFELFTREALNKIINKGIYSQGPFFQTEIRTYAHQFRITEVPIIYRGASHNISSNVIFDAFTNLWRLFKSRF